jgi:hypothetical protein
MVFDTIISMELISSFSLEDNGPMSCLDRIDNKANSEYFVGNRSLQESRDFIQKATALFSIT